MKFSISKKTYSFILLSLASFIAGLIYNESNILFLKDTSPTSLREGRTIKTADDASYIAPAKNLVTHGILKNNDNGIQSHYERPPAYPVFLSIFYKLFNTDKALQLIKYFQLLLFALSSAFLYIILTQLHIRKSIIVVCYAIYGLSPFCSGFQYYSLSEAIVLPLIVFYLYHIVLFVKQKKKINLIFSSILLAIIIATRPVFALLSLISILTIFKNRKEINSKIKIASLHSCIILSLFGIWTIRNYNLTNRIISPHPIYEPTNNSEFRPTHKAMWQLAKLWGETGSTYHSYMPRLWNNSIKGNIYEEDIQYIIDHFPTWAKETIKQDNLKETLSLYQKSILFQKEYYDRKMAMPFDIPEIEIEVIKQLKDYRNELLIHHPIECFIISPAKVFKRIAFHSNLNLYMFQNTFRGNTLMEGIRLIFFIIHSLLFLILPFSLIYYRKFTITTFFAYTAILYILFLMYYQVGIEERYTLPILPILIINAAVFLNNIKWVSILKREK